MDPWECTSTRLTDEVMLRFGTCLQQQLDTVPASGVLLQVLQSMKHIDNVHVFD
jgi:hypothetical protein